MRRGPFALGLFVLMALCATATSARAAENPPPSLDWCVRAEPAPDREKPATAATLADASLAFTPESPAPVHPIAPGPESLLCTRGASGPDCQAQDPANRPPSPSPISFASSDLVSESVPELPDPDLASASLPPGCLGSARPGFARGLYRPPRV